jgi:hypothetical protein
MSKSKSLRNHRFSGPFILVRNEDPAPDAPVQPEDVAILDQAGRPVGNSAAALPVVAATQTHPGVRNASASLATVASQRLTTFVVGLRADPVDDLVSFLAPMVAAGLKFEYLVASNNNNLATVDGDVVGQNGLPGVIVFDAESTASGTLQFRGLETPFTQTDRDGADAVPGWGARQEEERRITRLRNAIVRGRAQRVLAAAATAAGGAVSQAWTGSDDPIALLKADITTVADAIGAREFVRICFGSTAWGYLTGHAKLTGGTSYPYQLSNLQRIADLLELPAGNIKVSYHQAVSSKQGLTSAKGRIFTAAEAYIFGCSPTPTLDDPSFLKTFYMNLNGQPMSAYQWNPHPLVTNLGVAYYDLVKATNAAAVVRRTYTV